MQDSENLREQSFYTEPPYSYRPSVAEYLSTFKVTMNGILADILHLDRKKKIKIENYTKDGLEIMLKDNSDLNDNELFLWKFLEGNAAGGRAKIRFSALRRLTKEYENLVIRNAGNKFGSAFGFDLSRIPLGFALFGFLASFALGILTNILTIPFFFPFLMILSGLTDPLLKVFAVLSLFCAVLAIPFAIIYLMSIAKIGNSGIERKFLLREIILAILKLYLLMWGVLFLLQSITQLLLPVIVKQPQMLVVFFACLAVVYFYYCSYFGKIAYKFFYWLFETKESAMHRRKWLSFKDFIISYSALIEKPLKYYELWGEFYYYALAVGVIKKPI